MPEFHGKHVQAKQLVKEIKKSKNRLKFNKRYFKSTEDSKESKNLKIDSIKYRLHIL